jgi:hypothetical protein
MSLSRRERGLPNEMGRQMLEENAQFAARPGRPRVKRPANPEVRHNTSVG